jgi:hypothetical protein
MHRKACDPVWWEMVMRETKRRVEERQAKGATLRLSGPRRQGLAIDRVIYGCAEKLAVEKSIAEWLSQKRPMLLISVG